MNPAALTEEERNELISEKPAYGQIICRCESISEGEIMKTADDFYTGTRAALAGGTTSIIDFAEPQIGESLLQGLNNWHRKADHRCFCDYGFHMTVTHWDAEMGEEIDAMLEKGITSFKAYLTYKDSIGVEDSELYYLMGKIHDAGGLLLVHCENGDLIDSRIRDLKETAPGQIMARQRKTQSTYLAVWDTP